MRIAAGTVCWVTGASAGIGEALARDLAARGAKLVLSARRREELERVAAACGGREQAVALPLDQGDLASAPERAREAIAAFGRVDVVIHNAGLSQRSLAEETRIEVDERLLRVNTLGPIALTKAVLPHMLERKSGHLVVVTSLVGVIGTPLRSSYSASKHALHGFFDSLRAEVADRGVRVTIACPGFVNTDVSLNAVTGDGSAQGTMDEATRNGISPERCASGIVRAIEGDRTEVYVGGREVAGVYLHRLSPALFARLVRRVKVR